MSISTKAVETAAGGFRITVGRISFIRIHLPLKHVQQALDEYETTLKRSAFYRYYINDCSLTTI